MAEPLEIMANMCKRTHSWYWSVHLMLMLHTFHADAAYISCWCHLWQLAQFTGHVALAQLEVLYQSSALLSKFGILNGLLVNLENIFFDALCFATRVLLSCCARDQALNPHCYPWDKPIPPSTLAMLLLTLLPLLPLVASYSCPEE